jgi:hypothetical protein
MIEADIIRKATNYLAQKIEAIATTVVELLEEKEYRKRPLKYEIYKKQGAFQFRLLPAYARGSNRDNGCIFIECSKAVGERQYEFQSKKITFALSEKDIGLFLSGLKGLRQSGDSFSLVHDPNAQTDKKGTTVKTFRITRGNNSRLRGFEKMPTFFISMTQKTQEELYKVKIPVEPSEMRVIQELLASSLTKILSWE